MRALLPELLRLLRFGLVGIAATLTHMGVAEAALLAGGLPAVWASVIGFVPAFAVSYLGHARVTFAGQARHAHALPRFFLIALGGFLASLGLLTAAQGQPLPEALRLALSIAVIPAITYVLARLWAFADPRAGPRTAPGPARHQRPATDPDHPGRGTSSR